MRRPVYLSRIDFRHRVLALGCAALILAFGLCAASASLHQQLHDGDHGDHGDHGGRDDGCAVALFAAGVATEVPVLALPPAAGLWRELPAVVAPEVLRDAPRYLLQPERGPPVA